MNLDQALETFIVESRELLEDMESTLLGFRQADDTDEAVNRIFRAAHTIKGSAGLFGLDHIVAFTHVAESVLDGVRDHKIPVTDELIALLLSCGDHLNTMIAAVAKGSLGPDASLEREGTPLLEALRVYLDAEAAPAVATVAVASTSETVHEAEVTGDTADAEHWHLSLRFGPDVLRNGMDPLSFLQYLQQFGEIVSIQTLTDALPEADRFDPESCYLGFEIAFRSDADKAKIESVFEFVRDDCRITILPPRSSIAAYRALIEALPEDNARVGELLLECGSLTRKELQRALHAQIDASQPVMLGEVLIEQGAVRREVVDAALAKQNGAKQPDRSVRVDAEKLDKLINLVGELIISAAGANLIARGARIAELEEATSVLSNLVEEVRDSALQLRMVKIGATFNRFQRVVHDVSRELGKDITLKVSGEDTELDKTVVEKLGDPLTHLVRNAMDHGIEPAELRTARGKPAQGTLRLNAYHDSGSIVIEVSDDGGGLKRDRILAKAIERGLIEPGRNLSDGEIYNLIFEPGFSTAEAITNLSGRGVGMDVVKRNITALRGTVEVDSEEGAGTTVTVRLPLTLAIIDGFMVGLGRTTFVVPLDMIEECVEFPADNGHDYVDLRGQVLPFVRLRELFEIEGEPSRRQSIVVIRNAGQKAGLVVDNLLGEFQTVIKPLGRMFSHVKCISGSTIRGNGDVALILDVPALMQHAAGDPSAASRPETKAVSPNALLGTAIQ